MKRAFIAFCCSVFVMSVLYVFYNQYVNKKLSTYNVSRLNKVNVINSPNFDQRINVFLGGGIFTKTDYTYIGQLENTKTHKKRNFFILKGGNFKIKWIDDHHLSINGKKISDKGSFDFRNIRN